MDEEEEEEEGSCEAKLERCVAAAPICRVNWEPKLIKAAAGFEVDDESSDDVVAIVEDEPPTVAAAIAPTVELALTLSLRIMEVAAFIESAAGDAGSDLPGDLLASLPPPIAPNNPESRLISNTYNEDIINKEVKNFALLSTLGNRPLRFFKRESYETT